VCGVLYVCGALYVCVCSVCYDLVCVVCYVCVWCVGGKGVHSSKSDDLMSTPGNYILEEGHPPN